MSDLINSDDGDKRSTRVFTRRAILLGVAQVAGFGALGSRLYQLQVMEGRRYAPLAEDNRINLQVLAPRRGRILDRAGRVLAANEESFRIIVYPSLTADLGSTLKLVSRIVPLAAEEQERLIAKAKSQGRHAQLVVAEDLSFEQVASLNLLAPQLPGVQTDTAYRRKYFGGMTMGHLAGYVGSVERHALDEDMVLRLPDMKTGKSGIERGMETELRGAGGTRKFEVDARGRIVRNLEETDPVAGQDVVITVDSWLQARVHQRLAREGRAALVVLDIASGEVAAMASTPAYDPAVIMDGVSEAAWHELSTGENQPLLNRAISGLYPPGSTFKMVTALAGLEAGVMSLRETVDCGGSYGLADQTYRCWKRGGHGRCDMHRALRESCDVYFYEIANRVGIERLATMARRLGFGQIFPSGLALQKAGVVPDSEWKRAQYGKNWLGGETILTGIGQGYMLATPLQLAVMAARLASGVAVEPTLVRRDAASGPAHFAPLEVGQTGLDAVRRGMFAAVNEAGGTGGNVGLGAGRPLIAGKTGTSQVSRATSDNAAGDVPWEQRDHALFVAYFPADAPRYAISTVVEHGGGGGATAAPLVRDVIGYILDDDPMSKSAPPGAANAPVENSAKRGG